MEEINLNPENLRPRHLMYFDFFSRTAAEMWGKNRGDEPEFHDVLGHKTLEISLDLAYANSRKHAKYHLESAPSDFSFPAVSVSLSYDFNENMHLATTEYGRMRRIVKGPDGNIYKINNSYVFNNKGGGVKVEQISNPIPPGHWLPDWGSRENLIGTREELVPGEKGVLLDPGDYEILESLIKQMRNGEWDNRF